MKTIKLLFLILVLAFIAIVAYRYKGRRNEIHTRVHCGTNMDILAKAMLIYSNDFDDKFPTSSKWCDLLVEHAEVWETSFRCRSAPEGPGNYAINNAEQLEVFSPPDVVVLFETHPGWNQSGGPEILTTDNHQGEGCHVLFMDSHVAFVKTEDLKRLRWKPDM